MLGAIVRFIVSAVVLLLVSWIVPGMELVGFGSALLAAVVIAVLGWGAEKVLGEGRSPQNRGIVSFVIAAVVIYATQWIVADFTVTIIGALLAAFVIGLIDTFVPTELR